MSHHQDHNHAAHNHDKSALALSSPSLKDYVPLGVVVSAIVICSAALASAYGHSFDSWMMSSMGFFFLFFALFKLIDLSGFKEGFAHYDLIASRFTLWGYIYPFVELALGAGFIFMVHNRLLYAAALVVSLLNVISVAIKLAKKERFMCACLGTVLKVPLTTVTLFEYSMMAVMAAVMLLN